MAVSTNRVAIIDMGTNTFHLMIADLVDPDSFNILFNEKIAVKIGEGGISESHISEGAQERGLEALRYYRRTILENDVNHEEVYATSALRSATNSHEFLNKILLETGFTPRIINGQEEAEFIYNGVLASMELSDDMNLIMDIGGGSVEFIIANKNQIYWRQSYEIGAQRLKDQFHTSDPISGDEINKLESFLDNELNTLVRSLKKYKPETLIGVSGTFDTLSDIFEIRNDIPSTSHLAQGSFSMEAFEPLRKELMTKPLEERLKTPGLISFRAEMIVVALSLIGWVLKGNNFKQIRISRYSLKEGILYLMNKNKS